VLSVIDIHLVLRGAGDVLFVLLALTALPEEAPRVSSTGGRAPTLTVPERSGVATAGGRAAEAMRNVLDVSVASLALVVLAMPMAIIAVAVKVSSPGPVLFRQRRIGRNRAPFTLLKFRTMPTDTGREAEAALRELIAAEMRGEDTTHDGSTKLSAEVATGLGAWLRRTSLDELPQLINILRREMSLVGPRPCLEWEAAMFPAEAAERFAVRPGLTGLWQVSGRSTLTTPTMLRLDTEYVRTRSIGGDIAILARTVPTVLRGAGAR
jgi:lipopolysaccharide/colanic/teichoic acid biosynthesis glycosyltransferase